MKWTGATWVPARSRVEGRDVGWASGLLALGLVEAVWVTQGAQPLAPAVVALLTLPLVWRRVAPSAVALLVTSALVVQLPWVGLRIFDRTFVGFVCLLVSLYAVGRHERWPRAIPVLLGCALAVAGVVGWHDRSAGSFLLALAFVTAAAATGVVVRQRSELSDLLDRQADALRAGAEVTAGMRVAEVRGRIAGEVQDLVRRRVHEMVARADAARSLMQSDPNAAAELVGSVEADGRAALDEMRTMVGVLRTADLWTPTSSAPSPHPGATTDGTPRPHLRTELPLARAERWLLAGVVALLVVETLRAPGTAPLAALTMAPPTIAFVIGARWSGPVAVGGLGLALAAVALLTALVSEGSWGDYLFPSVLVALAWSGGRLVRTQNDLVRTSRRRALALTSAADVLATAAATEERLSLARDLHDVLAHTLMVMVVQAGAARRTLERGRPAAQEALAVVTATGRAASAELERLLTLVEPEGAASGASAVGAAGLADLPSLVERARSSGLAADLVVEGDPATVPHGLAVTAYRIAQEAVTNAIRHAGASRVDVRLLVAPDLLRLEVSDDGRGADGTPPYPAGNGITGMRERAALHGGLVRVGPSPKRGYVVGATFPLTHARQEQSA